MRRTRRSALGPLALLLLVGPGCLGQIGATKQETGACGGAPEVGATPLRRLTRFEYNQTVHDLLGDTTQPANAFPADEIRAGFDNNSAVVGVSPALTEAYLNAAESLAKNAMLTPANLLSCDPAKLSGAADEDACATQFIQSFGKRAYRRPLSDDDTARLLAVFHAGRTAQDFATGIRYVIETALQSPQFLYRVELALPPADGAGDIAPLDSYEMATRLSYLLWSSMPDDALFAAADADEIKTPDQLRAQVMRMLADPRAHGAVAHFNQQWLKLDKMASMEKDAKAYPAFNASIVPLMQQEVQQFLEEVMWGQKGDLHELLTAPYSFMNGPLATYYGVGGAGGSDFVRVDLDPARSAGFLTLGGVMAMLGKADQSAPVQRGRFVREQLLCGMMPSPPPNVPKLPPLSPDLTTRERLTQHDADPACHSCHRLMDPIGFGFEKFDGAGLFRTTESGQPIDDSGEIEDADIAGPFTGAAELGQKLSQSLFVQKCVVTSWFHYAYARLEAPEDQCTLKTLSQKFAASGYRFQDLIVALTETDAFRYRRVSGGAQ